MPVKPPAFNLHKSPILWELSWQNYLNDLYFKNSKSIKKLLVLESTPDAVIRQAFKNSHVSLCQLQHRIFNFAAERCAEDDFGRKWRAAGSEAQEKCYFHAMRRIAETPGMEVQREFAPEITLSNFRANNGWGYLELLRSLLPGRLVVNEYIRIPNPVLDAALSVEGPFDTSNAIPTERDRLVHKAVDVARCTFMSTAVWFTLCSFYNVTGNLKLSPTLEAAQNSSSDSAQGTNKNKGTPVPNQVKPVCGNCKKRAFDFPDLTFKSCAKCKGTPNAVMYCSRECQVNDWKDGDPPHKLVCGKPKPRSAALLKQMAMLVKNPSIDYFLIRPEPSQEVGITFGGGVDRTQLFRRVRKLAFEKCDRTAVGMMYELLESEIKTMSSDLALDGLDAQITQEFGFTVEEIREELKTIDRFWDKLRQARLSLLS